MITNKDISIDSENGKITLNGNKYDLGTQGEIDAAVKDVYSVMGQNGAKNLIPHPYYESSITENGITWTVNADGSITADGTATANETFVICYNFIGQVKEGTDLILSGCPSGGSAGKYRLGVDKNINSFVGVASDYGEGAQFKMPSDASRVRVFAIIYNGTTVSNITFKPMLRLAADTDNTYEPYAMTNKQLTDQLATKQDSLTFDTTPTDASANPVTSGGLYNTIGDLTQTGVTGASVAAQLGALDTDLGNKIKQITPETQYYTSTSTNLEYTGVSVECPAGHLYIVRAKCDWSNANTQSIAVSDSASDASTQRLFANSDSACATFMLAAGETAYIWGKWAAASRNAVLVNITDITL